MRIVLFINGILPQSMQAAAFVRPGDLIYCADGGANLAIHLGLQPDRLIGDLDSISPENLENLRAANIPIDKYPAEKDQTDLELALIEACREKPATILVVGAFGGRPDHMLANLFIFTRAEYARQRIVLLEADTQVTFLHAGQSLEIDGAAGDILSLIPLSHEVTDVCLAGVKWELRQESLSLGTTRTISNEMTAASALVRIGTGVLGVMYRGQGAGFL